MEQLLIIGAGPAGLSAAVYAARAQLKPTLIQGSVPGGQLTQTTEVENYPGFDKSILGTTLMAQMTEQAKRFGTKMITDEVTAIEKVKAIIQVKTQSGAVYQAKSVLVATGASAKWLGLESETRLRGKGVSACATCDGFFFRDKIVAIIGGGDTAMEEANFLTKFANKVYLIHRRDSFRASKIMQQRVLNNPKITVIYNAQVQAVLGEEKVTGLKLIITQNQQTKEQDLVLDGVFVAIGHLPATTFLNGSGVVLDKKGYIYTSQRVAIDSQQGLLPENIKSSRFDFAYQYQTSVPGIFAAGDCVDYQYRQAVIASGMGVAAELEAEKFLLTQSLES